MRSETQCQKLRNTVRCVYGDWVVGRACTLAPPSTYSYTSCKPSIDLDLLSYRTKGSLANWRVNSMIDALHTKPCTYPVQMLHYCQIKRSSVFSVPFRHPFSLIPLRTLLSSGWRTEGGVSQNALSDCYGWLYAFASQGRECCMRGFEDHVSRHDREQSWNGWCRMHPTLIWDLHRRVSPPRVSNPECFDAVLDELLIECRKRLLIVEEM